MYTFGASAPPKMLIQKFGVTTGVIARVARERVALACKEREAT
jgi:transketolase